MWVALKAEEWMAAAGVTAAEAAMVEVETVEEAWEEVRAVEAMVGAAMGAAEPAEEELAAEAARWRRGGGGSGGGGGKAEEAKVEAWKEWW